MLAERRGGGVKPVRTDSFQAQSLRTLHGIQEVMRRRVTVPDHKQGDCFVHNAFRSHKPVALADDFLLKPDGGDVVGIPRVPQSQESGAVHES